MPVPPCAVPPEPPPLLTPISTPQLALNRLFGGSRQQCVSQTSTMDTPLDQPPHPLLRDPFGKNIMKLTSANKITGMDAVEVTAASNSIRTLLLSAMPWLPELKSQLHKCARRWTGIISTQRTQARVLVDSLILLGIH